MCSVCTAAVCVLPPPSQRRQLAEMKKHILLHVNELVRKCCACSSFQHLGIQTHAHTDLCLSQRLRPSPVLPSAPAGNVSGGIGAGHHHGAWFENAFALGLGRVLGSQRWGSGTRWCCLCLASPTPSPGAACAVPVPPAAAVCPQLASVIAVRWVRKQPAPCKPPRAWPSPSQSTQ